MAEVKDSPKTRVITGIVRLSYAHVWEPKKDDDDKVAKYSTALLIPKSDTETVRKINAAIEAAKIAGKESTKLKWGGKIPSGLKLPLRDGDEKDGEEYKDHWFLNAKTKDKPQIVDRKREPIIDEGRVYSGCYAIVSISFYPFDADKQKGVAVALGNIMFVKDGEPFSGGSTAEEDFADVTIDDSDVNDFL